MEGIRNQHLRYSLKTIFTAIFIHLVVNGFMNIPATLAPYCESLAQIHSYAQKLYHSSPEKFLQTKILFLNQSYRFVDRPHLHVVDIPLGKR